MATARRNARSRQSQQYPTWLPLVLSIVGMVLGVAAVVFGYPGVVLTWLIMTVAAWTAPPAEFTGKKDASGFPTAAHAGETRAMQRYRFWADLKWRLIFPINTMAPGWWPYAAWVYGLWAAAVFWSLPYSDHGIAWLGETFRFLDAVTAFTLVTQVAAARRRTVSPGDVSPGVRIDAIKHVRGADRKTLAIGGAVTVAATVGGAVLADAFLPSPPVPYADIAWYVLGGVGGFGAGAAWWWVKASLTPWRELVAARNEWAPRWQMLKQDPPPFLIARDRVGNATVDTFDADGSHGASVYYQMAAKITPTMGSGVRLAVISVPNTDSQDQPVPGTRHPLRFQVVYWPADALPEVMDPAADADEVSLFFQCAMVWVCDASGYARPIIDEATPLALTSAPAPAPRGEPEDGDDDDSEGVPDAGDGPQVSRAQAWQVSWLVPEGPPFRYLRTVLGPDMSGILGAEVLADQRALDGQGAMYIGDLTSGNTVFDPSMGVEQTYLTNLSTEDAWNSRWADVLKQDVNPPTIDHGTYREARLGNGKTMHRQAFITLLGVDPMDFWGLEAKIAATLNAAPFVAVAGWTSSGRPGERHAQAFTVYWSHEVAPANPDTLAPSQKDRTQEAAKWVLAGRMNQAFKAARLAAPEVYNVRCLTQPRSRGHIWEMSVRLYGGVTLSDVRGAAQRLRQSLGSEWLRVKAVKDGCVIVAGAAPSRVRLTNPDDERLLASLDWEQAYLDAKITGVGGLTPTLVAVDRLPRNDQVQVLDFTLPSGLTFVEIKGKSKALETSTKNAFVDVRRHPSGKADEIRILASEVNPMPEVAEFDFVEASEGGHKIPFATNLFGEPTAYDNKTDPMLLVVGAAGGGKSVALQNLVYGALVRDWDLWVADPAKGGVDFQFAEDHSRAFARTIWETKGMIEAIYTEVMARKAINAQYNCGNYRDLPDEVRYNHTLIVLDEFTSMMLPEPVPKAMDDSPETLQAIEGVKAINAARAYVGTYVGKIVREARSTGFTMLLATQALKADTLSKIPGANDLKDNMSRMIMGRASFGQLQAALKMPTEAPEQPEYLPPGRGMYEGNGRAAEVIQCWFEPSQQVFASNLATRVTPVPVERKIDLSGFVEPVLQVEGMVVDSSTRPLPPVPGGAPEVVEELPDFEFSLDDLDFSLDDPDPSEAAAVGSEPVAEVAVESHVVWDDVDPTDWEPETSEHGWTEIDALLAFLDDFGHVREVTWESRSLVPYLDHVTQLLAQRGVTLHTGAAGVVDAQESVASVDPADGDVVVVDTHVSWDEVDPTQWEPSESAFGWTEIDALMGFVTDFPATAEVTWTDAHLLDEDEMGVTFADVVIDLLSSRGIAFVGPQPVSAPPQPEAAQVTPPPGPAVTSARFEDFNFDDVPPAPKPPAASDDDDRFEDF